jgi:aminoglycoside 3-N-acetyltransferase I
MLAATEQKMSVDVRLLTPDDLSLMDAPLTMFGESFDDIGTFGLKRPGPKYMRRLLGGDGFIALVALKRGEVVGGLAAYELHKFEQERSEIYIYDLAVAATHRRAGIATALIDGMSCILISISQSNRAYHD